jgi:hypothetical protein
MFMQSLFHMRLFRLIVLTAVFAGVCSLAWGSPKLQTGDLIFQTSLSAQSLAIQKATRSPYSHMGVILVRRDRITVLEAVGPVRETPLAEWTARGKGGHYVVKRLLLEPDAPSQARLIATARSFMGKPYDPAFEWSDTRMYCSELAWKLYDRALGVQIGHLEHLRDFHLNDPVVRAKLRERYGKHIPLDEPVISPAAMYASDKLFEVEQH